MSIGLYIHIPFCEHHCHYCSFPVSVAETKFHRPYLDCLLRELEMIKLEASPRTLYLGGGTPSLVDPKMLAKLVSAVVPGASEVSLEANPGTLGSEKLDLFLDIGINRISIGAQSFDKVDLERAGRLHEAKDTIHDFEFLRRKGFANINIDLICGIPGQNRESWIENLKWLERLRPDHVSIYLLDSEDSTFWEQNGSPVQEQEDQKWFFGSAAERLGAAGYLHYEVSHWALTGSECLHNLGYWDGTAYRGIGLGAHSFVDEKRFWNSPSMNTYMSRLSAGELAIENVEPQTSKIRLQEAFLLGLRQMRGVEVWKVAKEVGFDYPQEWFDRVESLVLAGLVGFDGNILRLTQAGWLLATDITEELLCPKLLSICEATQ